MTIEELYTKYDGLREDLKPILAEEWIPKKVFNEKNDEAKAFKEKAEKYDSLNAEYERAKVEWQENDAKTKREMLDMSRDLRIDMALQKAGCRNGKATKALLDIGKVNVLEDGSLENLDIDGLKKEYPYLFNTDDGKPSLHIDNTDKSDDKSKLENSIMKAFGL